MKLDISKEDAREALWGGGGWTIVDVSIVEQRRWVTVFRSVLKHPTNGKYYQVYYERGSTEYQDQQPFEYEEPEFVEVQQVVREVFVWEAV